MKSAMPKTFIHFHVNQVGIIISASQDKKTWQTVELQRFKEYSRPNFGKNKPFTFIDAERQKQEYLSFLQQKRIDFEVVRGELPNAA